MEPTWKDIKKRIDDYIVTYLFKIEWYYGENRAPFAYPPRFYMNRKKKGSLVYVCELVLEYPDAESIILEGKTPELLFACVKETLNSKFHNFDSASHNSENKAE